MPDGEYRSRRRDTLLRMPIGELCAWHLLVRCADCKADRYVEISTLVTRFGESATLAVLEPRLRCQVCRKPPASVILRNRYPAQMGGPALIAVPVRGEDRRV